MRDMFIDGGNEALRFLGDRIGIPFEVVRDLPDYFYPRVSGSRAEGRYIEVKPFAGSSLGAWAAKCGTSPYGAGYSYTTPAANSFKRFAVAARPRGSMSAARANSSRLCA